jgi:hypothetical protein
MNTIWVLLTFIVIILWISLFWVFTNKCKKEIYFNILYSCLILIYIWIMIWLFNYLWPKNPYVQLIVLIWFLFFPFLIIYYKKVIFEKNFWKLLIDKIIYYGLAYIYFICLWIIFVLINYIIVYRILIHIN